MEVSAFSDIEKDFLERVQQVVWCNLATIDRQNRPRSRVVHPLWEGAVAWITTRRNSFKSKHLTHNPYVSLAYVADVAKPVYVDCKAEWVDDPATKLRIWQLCKDTPPPMGFDLASIFGDVDHPNFGLLKLTPWRIELAVPFPTEPRIWRQELR